jgi:hypothetical protein
VVQLMGPRDMLDYWANTYKVRIKASSFTNF